MDRDNLFIDFGYSGYVLRWLYCMGVFYVAWRDIYSRRSLGCGAILDRRVSVVVGYRVHASAAGDGMRKRKPSRRDLLIVVEQLQNMIGEADGLRQNDRDQNAYSCEGVVLRKAHDLCIDARSFDDPVEGKSRNGWGEP